MEIDFKRYFMPPQRCEIKIFGKLYATILNNGCILASFGCFVLISALFANICKIACYQIIVDLAQIVERKL